MKNGSNEWVKQRRLLFNKSNLGKEIQLMFLGNRDDSPEKSFDEEWEKYCDSLKWHYFKHLIMDLITIAPVFCAIWYFVNIEASIIAYIVYDKIICIADDYNDTRTHTMHIWNALKLREMVEQIKEK